MLRISKTVSIPEAEIELNAIRAQGAGGQNVNKVATAIHLRFDIPASSLPEYYKAKLLSLNDKRITQEGVIVLKAQEHRTQEKNKEAALARLKTLIQSVMVVQKKRKPTQPSKAAQKKRMDSKTKRSRLKATRGKVELE